MDLRWTLTMFSVLCGSLLRGSTTATGLQIYYYRQPLPMNPNPIQSWKVEGLATLIVQSAFSNNLDCNTTSNRGAGIGWTGQVGFNPFWVQSLVNGKRLVLDSFTNANFGVYTCSDNATNESLKVNITSANPAIQAVSDVVTIEAGSSGQLKVYASGIPDPASTGITWFKVGPGGNITELKEPTVNFSSDHRTLLLSNVQESDGGTYICIVSQNFPLYPSANVIIQLAITRKNGSLIPAVMFTQQPSNLSLVQSANATLSCSAIGSPAPTITWRRSSGSGQIPYLATIVTYGNLTNTTSTLSIVNIQPQDGGQYQCQATVPGTTPVWSQPAFIRVQQQATPQSTTASTSTVLASTCDPTQGCTPSSSSSLQTTTPFNIIIVGTAAGGGAVLLCVGAVLLLYVCVYFRYFKPHKGMATWPENGTRTKSSTNVLFKVQDGDRTEVIIQSHTPLEQTPSTPNGESLYDRYVHDVPMTSHSNTVPIYSPLTLTAPEEPRTRHEYSGMVESSVPGDPYSKLQRDSLKRNQSSNNTSENAAHLQVIQTPGEITSGEQQYALSGNSNRNTSDVNGGSVGGGSVATGINSNSQPAVFQPLSQTAGKIPIRRHSSNTPAVVPEGPAFLYSSAISALSSVPASSLSITSPSNVLVGPNLVKRAPVTTRVGEKNSSSVLSSVPEHAVYRPYENVVIPAPACQVPTPKDTIAEAPAVLVGPPPGYEDVITTEQPWYELEETDSDVNVPVRQGVAGAVQRAQTLPHHTSRSGDSRGANAQSSATQNVRSPHRAVTYRGSLPHAPPPRTEPKRELYFSASSLSCGTTV